MIVVRESLTIIPELDTVQFCSEDNQHITLFNITERRSRRIEISRSFIYFRCVPLYADQRDWLNSRE